MCERVLAGAGGGGAGGWQRRREGRLARTARTAHRAAALDEIGYSTMVFAFCYSRIPNDHEDAYQLMLHAVFATPLETSY